ncbi:MAG: hypothetical protein Q9203_006583 [Teloschistes exilis]
MTKSPISACTFRGGRGGGSPKLLHSTLAAPNSSETKRRQRQSLRATIKTHYEDQPIFLQNPRPNLQPEANLHRATDTHRVHLPLEAAPSPALFYVPLLDQTSSPNREGQLGNSQTQPPTLAPETLGTYASSTAEPRL